MRSQKHSSQDLIWRGIGKKLSFLYFYAQNLNIFDEILTRKFFTSNDFYLHVAARENFGEEETFWLMFCRNLSKNMRRLSTPQIF